MTTEEINSVKLNKKLWVKGKVDASLLKYFPVKPKEKTKQLNFLNILFYLINLINKKYPYRKRMYFFCSD